MFEEKKATLFKISITQSISLSLCLTRNFDQVTYHRKPSLQEILTVRILMLTECCLETQALSSTLPSKGFQKLGAAKDDITCIYMYIDMYGYVHIYI